MSQSDPPSGIVVDLGEVPPPRAPRRLPVWPFVLAGLLLAISAALVWAWNITLPYFALSPGPVLELADLVDVEGTETFDSSGDLFMLTVSLQEVNPFEFVQGVFDQGVDLVDRDVIRPRDVTPDEYQERNLGLMDASKRTAVVVALQQLGYEVNLTGDGVRVAAVLEGTPADGLLQEGDIVVAVAGRSVHLAPDAISEIGSHEVGETLILTVLRGEQEMEVAVTLIEHTQQPGRPMVGFLAETYNERLDLDGLPFSIDIDTSNIGGPSAGMMYTLAVIELLSAEDLAKGHVIAGTGTISSDRTVGAIGGVRQKVVAAHAAGAEYVLVPAGNYEEALTVAREGTEIIPVASLDDALEFLAGLSPA